ncbi:MAG: Gfo/Idh/MocA family oxidoreductase [Firmicutes bacterium]|jgi:predicted dehydrogenase|nr:Gfo/Idh/MocA family oxidoreductase [Bacillota bacterium]
MVRIGLLGIAHLHFYSYASAVQRLPNAELVGLYDDDAARAEEAAKLFSTTFYKCPEELLKNADAVIICSENSFHRKWVELAAKHGKDILCEKPIATTVADAEAMIKACDAAGVRLQIAFPVRFSTPMRRVKAMLEQGALGELLAVRGTNRGRMPGGWFIDRELAGGGAVMDHTVHVVDVVRWFTGREVVSVYAEVDSMIHDIDIDDCGMLCMELEGGVPFTQDPSWSRPSSYHTWGDVTLQLVGTKGTISVDALAQSLTVYSNAEGKMVTHPFTEDMDLELIKDFVEMVETKRSPSITGFDGLQAMAVALAAYESAKQGKPVTLR